VRHRELLATLAELEPITIEGTFERHSSLRRDELSASASGGRWGAPRAYEVLYLGRPRDTVVIEAYRHLVDDELDDAEALAAQVVERRLTTCQVAASNVIDLRPTATQLAVGLSDSTLTSSVGDYGPCQAVGAAVHQLGHAGIIAPAATRIGETLALFPTNLAIEDWPSVVSRQIWHGLPPDPRRLRAVEDKVDDAS
jgi:hypothetical protein